MTIQELIQQEAERRYPIKEGYSIMQIIRAKEAQSDFISGCNFLLQHLSGQEGDAHEFLVSKGVTSIGNSFSAYTIQKWMEELIAIHTAKALANITPSDNLTGKTA